MQIDHFQMVLCAGDVCFNYTLLSFVFSLLFALEKKAINGNGLGACSFHAETFSVREKLQKGIVPLRQWNWK